MMILGCDSLVGEVGVLLSLFIFLQVSKEEGRGAAVLLTPPTTTMGILRNPSVAVESTLPGRLLLDEFFRVKEVDDFAEDEDTFELFDDFVSIEDDLPLLVLCCCCSTDELELLALLVPFLVVEVVVAVPLLIFVLIPLVDDDDDET